MLQVLAFVCSQVFILHFSLFPCLNDHVRIPLGTSHIPFSPYKSSYISACKFRHQDMLVHTSSQISIDINFLADFNALSAFHFMMQNIVFLLCRFSFCAFMIYSYICTCLFTFTFTYMFRYTHIYTCASIVMIFQSCMFLKGIPNYELKSLWMLMENAFYFSFLLA